MDSGFNLGQNQDTLRQSESSETKPEGLDTRQHVARYLQENQKIAFKSMHIWGGLEYIRQLESLLKFCS